MALPRDMRLKGHRSFNYIHKNSIKYHGKLMTFKLAKSNPEILLSHKPRRVIPASKFIIKSLFAGPPS